MYVIVIQFVGITETDFDNREKPMQQIHIDTSLKRERGFVYQIIYQRRSSIQMQRKSVKYLSGVFFRLLFSQRVLSLNCNRVGQLVWEKRYWQQYKHTKNNTTFNPHSNRLCSRVRHV